MRHINGNWGYLGNGSFRKIAFPTMEEQELKLFIDDVEYFIELEEEIEEAHILMFYECMGTV